MRKAVKIFIDVLFWLCMLLVCYVVGMVFLFASYRVPTGSMEPALLPGDYVLVSKPVYGARLFNLFATLRLEQVEIYRLPGLRRVRRGDVVVFNAPYASTQEEKIAMHILKYYVKRCIGLPGDSLQIEEGVYRVRGVDVPLGNTQAQRRLPARPDSAFVAKPYTCFPHDTAIGWTPRTFGPLYIPRRGDVVEMNRLHYLLYKNLIEWEQNAVLTYTDSVICLDGQPIATYRFEKNYYFMAGDNTASSLDSRYWGLLPETYIAGKVWLIWKSTDLRTGKLRWERFLKKL